MKIIFFRTTNKKDDNCKRNKLSIDKILLHSFAIVFSLMIVVQILLVNFPTNSILTLNSDYEGTPLALEEQLYEEGIVRLELLNYESNSNIKILLNGEEIETFKTRNIDLKVKDGDVIEIDGSSFQEEAEVLIIAKSENINKSCVSKCITVKSNVVSLSKIILK